MGGLVRPATPLFLPSTCHRQDHGGNPSTMPVPMGKRPRSLPIVRQRIPRPTRQAASHADFASVRLRHHRPRFLKSFSPYPIRIRTIGKARPMEADFQGVPFSSFISHRQHPLRMGFPRQLRPLPSPLPPHLCHRVLHPPHR